MLARICSLHLLKLSVLTFFCLLGGVATAHQVPSLGLEVDLHQSAPSTIKLDIDPRLVVSSTPTQLPPIPADWYRSLNDADRQQTLESAVRFILGNIVFKSGQEPVMLNWKFTPVDGSNAVPLSDDSKEIHLLAQATATLHGPDFVVSLGKDCAAALTMIAAVDGTPERRPQVLFPGETSRPVKIVKDLAEPKVEAAPAPQPPVLPSVQQPALATSEEPSKPWFWEPFKLGLLHFIHQQDVEYTYEVRGSGFVMVEFGWTLSHIILAVVVAFLARSISRAIRALLLFHGVHFLFTLVFAQTGTVIPMPELVWPMCVLALGFVAWKLPNLAIPCLLVAALLHNLDEWPHAAGIPVLSMIELGFLVSGIALQLLVSGAFTWFAKMRSGK